MDAKIDQDEILDTLKKARLFNQFGDKELSALITHSLVEDFRQDDIIIHEGQKNNRFFILLRGTVSVYAEDEFITDINRIGDIFGEMSMITKRITTASIIAKSPVTVFAIPATEIFDSENTELRSMVYKIFLDILTDKLALTTNRVKGFKATSDELHVKKQELAKSKDNLQQKEVILQSVLGSMSDGVVVTTMNGKMLHVNAAFINMIGDLAVPMDFKEWPETLGFYHDDETTLYSTDELPMLKALQGDEVDSEEIYVKNHTLKEGIWLQAGSRLLISEENEGTRGAVVVFRDYTKKKKEEQALIKAKENAESMAKAKSDFLAVMSHELRTPLNGIMGMTDLIYGMELSPEQKDCMDTIKAGSESLLTLIRNILDYSNLESGTIQIENKPFSIEKNIREIVDNYQIHTEKKGLKLITHIDPSVSQTVIGFERGFKQVVRNLLDNAVKFSEKVEIRLLVTQTSKNDGTADIRFTIQDKGIGIAEDHIPELFKPFTQADSSYARKFEGTGIGLSICHKLVEHMQGEITASSKPGKGSVFTFSMKVSEVSKNWQKNVLSSELTNKDAVPLSQAFSKHYPLKILVAEDNHMNQKIISKVLNKLGYSPHMANNGLEAVACVRKESFDLILMDLQMPEMDGIEATRTICTELSGEKQPVIIALTANVSDEVKKRCYAAGMKDYITKPMKINTLVQVLLKYV